MAKDLWGVEENTEVSGPVTDAYGFPMEPHYGKPTGYDVYDRPVDEYNQPLYPNQQVAQGPYQPGRFDPNVNAAQQYMQSTMGEPDLFMKQHYYESQQMYYDANGQPAYGPQVGHMPNRPSFQPMPSYGNFARGMEDSYVSGYAVPPGQMPQPMGGTPMQQMMASMGGQMDPQMMAMMSMMAAGPQMQEMMGPQAQQQMAPYEVPYSSSYMDGGAPTCMDEALRLYYGS